MWVWQSFNEDTLHTSFDHIVATHSYTFNWEICHGDLGVIPFLWLPKSHCLSFLYWHTLLLSPWGRYLFEWLSLVEILVNHSTFLQVLIPGMKLLPWLQTEFHYCTEILFRIPWGHMSFWRKQQYTTAGKITHRADCMMSNMLEAWQIVGQGLLINLRIFIMILWHLQSGRYKISIFCVSEIKPRNSEAGVLSLILFFHIYSEPKFERN